ncbi:hypothetical protein [Streptomyces sp. cg36]|uniref:hypothetical protein n=1 Tax=Streptomyces sp. cg36 TaxID=3238798 RepID=UPI0034E21F0A
MSVTPLPAADEALRQYARSSLAEDERAWGPKAHPAPIPLRYATVGADFTDPGPTAPDLSGTYDDIGEVFALAGSHRLVILGDEGSGKTELARQLGVSLLADAEGVPRPGARTDADPGQDVTAAVAGTGAALPVMISLTDWTAEDEPYGMAGWLARRLTGTRTGADDVHALLTQRRLLPILDDFDQLPARARAHVLHALDQLPQQAPFVLVSGWKEFTDTVERTDTVIARSVGIRICRLDVADLDGWIQRTFRTVSKTAEWSQVLEALRADANAPARELLSDPFFAGAARLLYSDGRADPGELVRDGVTTAGLEARLLERLLGATAPPPRRTGSEPVTDAQVDKALRLVASATNQTGEPVRKLRSVYLRRRQRRRSAAAYGVAFFFLCLLIADLPLALMAAIGGYLYLRHDLERPLLGGRLPSLPRWARLSLLGECLLGLLGVALVPTFSAAESTQLAFWARLLSTVTVLGCCCLLLATLDGAWLRANIRSLLQLNDLTPPRLEEALDLARRRGLLQCTGRGITFTHPAVARWYGERSSGPLRELWQDHQPRLDRWGRRARPTTS